MYARFLKKFCTTKRTTDVHKRSFLASNVSSVIPNQIFINYKDPGCPTIFIMISDHIIHRALLELEASVSLFPFNVHKRLRLCELKPAKIVL